MWNYWFTNEVDIIVSVAGAFNFKNVSTKPRGEFFRALCYWRLQLIGRDHGESFRPRSQQRLYMKCSTREHRLRATVGLFKNQTQSPQKLAAEYERKNLLNNHFSSGTRIVNYTWNQSHPSDRAASSRFGRAERLRPNNRATAHTEW